MGRKDHFCNPPGETLYDYNANLFAFDRKKLSDSVRQVLGISDEDLPVYIYDFDSFVNDYSAIETNLKRGIC